MVKADTRPKNKMEVFIHVGVIVLCFDMDSIFSISFVMYSTKFLSAYFISN